MSKKKKAHNSLPGKSCDLYNLFFGKDHSFLLLAFSRDVKIAELVGLRAKRRNKIKN